MKRLLPVFFALLILCGAAMAQEVKKLSLDDPKALGLIIEEDSVTKAEGKSSIKITTKWPTVVCLGETSEIDAAGARLVYRAKVRTELEGDAFLEMWVKVDGKNYFSRGLDDAIKGSSEWRELKTSFTFEKGRKPEKITLNLAVNGTGTVWIDDVVISKEPLK